MPHKGQAFSRAHINSCLLVAWEMLEYMHLWALFMGTTLNLKFDLAAAALRKRRSGKPCQESGQWEELRYGVIAEGTLVIVKGKNKETAGLNIRTEQCWPDCCSMMDLVGWGCPCSLTQPP